MTHAENISPSEANAWIQAADAPRVIDVRTTAEFNHDHLAGAVNVPLNLLEENAAAVAKELDGEVLIVCRTDGRARRAAVALAEHIGGRGHVLTGGMQAWQQAGLPVEKGTGGPWAMERQVRTTAGAIVLSSILASTRKPGAKWLAAGIGTGLLYSGISDTCGMAAVLNKAPWNRNQSVTLDSVLAELRA